MMYHTAKKGGRRRRKRQLWLGFCLAGVWAAALCWLLLAEWPGYALRKEPEATLVYRGERRAVPAGQTAGELLSSLGLTLTEEDVASLPLDTALQPGAVFTVERHQRRQETYTLTIPPEVEYRLDGTLPWGREAVLMEGTPGEMRCTALVDYVNGLEVRREVTARELLCPAQKELIAIGTRESSAPEAGGGFLWLPEGQLLTYTHTAAVEATAFTATDPGCSLPQAHVGTVAVDERFIAPGTRLYIVAADGSFTYGIAQAQASASMEGSRVDLYFPTAQECQEFGRKTCTVYFLG